MRIPTTAMADHLMWTRSGITWATWRLKPLSGGFGTHQMKSMTKLHHQALFQELRGEALLLGLCADLDPVTIVERMLEGVKIGEDTKDWVDEVERTLDALEQVPMGERAFWLSVPMSSANIKDRAWSMIRAADNKVRDIGALPRVLPRETEVAAARRMANEIAERIPAIFEATPATPAENIWIALHNQQRGLAVDGSVPLPSAAKEDASLFETDLTQFQLPAGMPNPWLDEGGQSDLAKGQQFLPFKRKYLKVQSPYADEASYQVLQAIVTGPKAGWRTPGVEWISAVDNLPMDVDFALRLQISPAAEVRKRNKRAEDALKDQYSQQEGTNSITGTGNDLAEVAEALKAYHESLNHSDKEVEAQVTVIFAVAGTTPEEAKLRARVLADQYKAHDFLLEAPLGGQEELWWAMQPGVPTTRLVRELAQITTGRELASGTPIVSSELGDIRGARFGVNITNGRRGQIFRDIEGNNKADISGSFGVVAEKGAGKSVLLKCEFGTTVDRGGRGYAIDRTVAHEYGTFARALRPDHTVIANLLEFEDEDGTVVRPEWNIDPLLMFGPRQGARILQSLFAAMLGIPVLSEQGVFLSSLLEGEYLASHGITSTRKLLQHLERDLSGSPEANELRMLIKVIASKDIGEVLFNDALPPVDTRATGIVFLTAGLTLPKKMELEQKHLFNEMPIEKRFGRAVYAMLTAVVKQLCFRDKTTLTGAFFDECHAITASPEGAAELTDFYRDDRKHNAFAAVGSHDPEDFGDERARGLIATRYLMRQRDRNLARRALHWFSDGLENDEAMLDLVTKNLSPLDPSTGKVPPHRRGEGLMLDVAGRMGIFQKTLPENPERRAAVLSTPSEAVAA